MSEDEEEEPKNEVSVGRFIARIAGVKWVASKQDESGWWWVKFQLDIQNPAAWHVVQGLAYVFNNLAINDPLPTVFFPTSSPPDMNGGPNDLLCWVVEPQGNDVDPSVVLDALHQSFIFEIEDHEQWIDWSQQDLSELDR